MKTTATSHSLPSETGWAGLAHRIAPQMFPLNPNSEQEFIALVQRRLDDGKSCRTEISGGLIADKAVRSRAIGLVGDFKYQVLCHAILDGNERIQFERYLFTRTGSLHGVGDSAQRLHASVVLNVATYEQWLRLTQKLPNAQVVMLGNKGEVPPDGMLQVVTLAAKEGITQAAVRKLFKD